MPDAESSSHLSSRHNETLQTFIQEMPKAELHVHLEGCLTPDLARKLSERNNMPPPPGLSSLDQSGTGYAFHDLTSFLALYYPNMTVLQTAEDFKDLAFDVSLCVEQFCKKKTSQTSSSSSSSDEHQWTVLIQKAQYLSRAAAQNIVHCELFFDPQAHTSRGVPFPTIISGYSTALQLASQQYNISASLIMCILRDESANYGMSTLLSSLPYKHLIVGLGLDSDERSHPPIEHLSTFRRARREGYHLTAHCDVDQANTLTHIRQALFDLGVDRLDHGSNIIDAPDLVDHIVKHGIGLTCCPISNSVVTETAKFPEILALLRRGVKMTVNSDDPAYFRGWLVENLAKMATETDITRRELLQLQRNAFEISWVSSWKRDMLLQRLEEYEIKTLGKAIE